jgi:hypothetical protein
VVAGAGAAAAAAAAAYVLLVRPWHLRWGAADEEAREPLPGDDLRPDANVLATHAVTINAPAADVWPWLVQIGQGRGGFYSYAWLENLVGCHMRNADRILPQFQDLKAGDRIYFHPKAPPAPVTVLEPGRALVIGDAWAFVLKELGPRTTRLIIRSRAVCRPTLSSFLGWRVVFEPAHFVMERRMMLTIKRLAEARADGRAAALVQAPGPAAVTPSAVPAGAGWGTWPPWRPQYRPHPMARPSPVLPRRCSRAAG